MTHEERGRGEMTVREAGRLGGTRLKEKRGREFFADIGRLGGAKVRDERGREYFAGIAKHRHRSRHRGGDNVQ